jgi:hypothetical protein
MLIELDAFDYLIRPHVNLIEDIATHDGVDRLIFSSPNAVDRSTRLIDSLRLSILCSTIHTEMFQVLIVPSCDPLTSTLFKTNRFETLLVCPINWFKIYP